MTYCRTGAASNRRDVRKAAGEVGTLLLQWSIASASAIPARGRLPGAETAPIDPGGAEVLFIVGLFDRRAIARMQPLVERLQKQTPPLPPSCSASSGDDERVTIDADLAAIASLSELCASIAARRRSARAEQTSGATAVPPAGSDGRATASTPSLHETVTSANSGCDVANLTTTDVDRIDSRR